MKQNKNTSAIRIFSFVLSLVVLSCSLCLPSFATDEITFSSSKLPVINSSDINASTYSSGLSIGVNSNSSGASYSGWVNASDDVYCFAISNGSNVPSIVFVSTSTFSSACIAAKRGSQYSGETNRSSQLDASTSLFYFSFTTYQYYWSTLAFNVPVFSSLADGLSAFLDFSSGGSSTPHPLSLSLPAGNCVYIDVTGVSTVRMSLSETTEVAHPQSWVTNQYYGYASQYPSSIAGNPSGSTPIPWSGTGKQTVFNRFQSFSWSLTAVNGSNYLFVCNPYASIDEYDQSFNPTISIYLPEAVGYKYYQLTGGIGSDGTIGQQSDGTTASGTYDDGTQSWSTTNDETGLPWTPQEGGGNIITQNSINSWLQTIATQIGNFFSGAIGAVTTLVSSGSDFIHSLSGLYSWLPGPVYAVLSSALILVITIGVIKVFI